MLDGGCDPLYIARRLLRMASEDVGNADPRALSVCLDACSVFERLGSPEGELALAQAVVYLACAPKSNAVYMASKAAKEVVSKTGSLEVPMHIRNAPTTLMKNLDYGNDYRYAHDFADAFVAGENYLPESIAGFEAYYPVNQGLEVKIKDKLNYYRELNRSNSWKRYS
jgi:putative ATPase